jgi:hypothetical protein
VHGIPGCTWDDNIKMDLKNVITVQKMDSCVSQWGRVPSSCKHGTEPSCSTMRGISSSSEEVLDSAGLCCEEYV